MRTDDPYRYRKQSSLHILPGDVNPSQIYARLCDNVATAVSQILLQKSLKPQQLRSQNETLIAQIKASELLVLRHLNHPSPPSLCGAEVIV
jgi:hypothetical protein